MKDTVLSYRWIVLGLAVAVLFTVATGGLSVVWLRQQIADVANENDELARSVEAIDRKRNRLEAQIAKVHNPIYLMAHARDGLRPTNENTQVVWMDMLGKPVPRPNTVAYNDGKSPLSLSVELALLDSKYR